MSQAVKFTELNQTQQKQARSLYKLNAKLETRAFGEPRTTTPVEQCSFYLDEDGDVDDWVFNVPSDSPEQDAKDLAWYEAELAKINQIKIK